MDTIPVRLIVLVLGMIIGAMGFVGLIMALLFLTT